MPSDVEVHGPGGAARKLVQRGDGPRSAMAQRIVPENSERGAPGAPLPPAGSASAEGGQTVGAPLNRFAAPYWTPSLARC